MSKSEKHPLTDDELCAIRCLCVVSYPSAPWDKLFNRDVLQIARLTHELSEKAVAQMWRLFIRYRRQINTTDKARLMKIAEEKAAPDFRKVAAAANEQAEIDKLKEKYGKTMLQG